MELLVELLAYYAVGGEKLFLAPNLLVARLLLVAKLLKGATCIYVVTYSETACCCY
jgi:hypothetical protein